MLSLWFSGVNTNPQPFVYGGLDYGPPMTTEEVVVALVEATAAAGLTGAEVAEAIGVSAQSVSNWANGRRTPRLIHLVAWADFVGLRVNVSVTPREAPPVADEVVARVSQLPAERQADVVAFTQLLAGAEDRDLVPLRAHQDAIMAAIRVKRQTA